MIVRTRQEPDIYAVDTRCQDVTYAWHRLMASIVPDVQYNSETSHWRWCWHLFIKGLVGFSRVTRVSGVSKVRARVRIRVRFSFSDRVGIGVPDT